ncbi:MAG: tetratricopeptide repeat protein [Verrucomicrobium sp.]|nr:tetratricopeptide repeat protein [Verrucomicrobium sp.]
MTEADLAPQQKNLWLKGVSAYQLKNFDYAISLIITVVKQAPEFLDGRRLLRRAEGEKFRGQKKGLFGGGLSLGGLKLGSTKKDPWEAIADLEENVFQKDPYNQSANQTLYDLAMRVGQNHLAAFALETIKEGFPTNTRNMHVLAQHYMAIEEPEKASDTYRAVLKHDPTDMDAIKGEKDAAAKTSMMRQGWQDNGGFEKAKKDKDQSNRDENLARQGMTPEQMQALLAQLAADYEKDPNNINVVKKIADLYERMEDLDSALSYYDWALTLNPGDVALQARIEQVRNRSGELRIQEMEAQIEANPDAEDIEEKREFIRATRRERLSTLLAEAKTKVERNPTDKQYRFDYATILFQAEQYREAIPELQQAKSNPHIRNKALLMLGKCFERLNMNDLAINAMGEAVKEIPAFNNEKKEILYQLGVTYQKVGKSDDYLNCMKEIYNNDYGYKDVAARVEASYG